MSDVSTPCERRMRRFLAMCSFMVLLGLVVGCAADERSGGADSYTAVEAFDAAALRALRTANEAGRFAEALRLSDSLRVAPLPDAQRGWVLKERAYSLIQTGRRDDARRIYFEAMSLFDALPAGRHASYLRWGAVNLVRTGYTLDALEVIERAERVALSAGLDSLYYTIYACKREVADSVFAQGVYHNISSDVFDREKEPARKPLRVLTVVSLLLSCVLCISVIMVTWRKIHLRSAANSRSHTGPTLE